MTSGGRSGANLMGADLYRSLTNYFSEHLKTVRDRAVADGLADDELLRYYTDEWKRYTVGASYVNRLFTYLNRHWIKREKDEGRKNIYPVYTVRGRSLDSTDRASSHSSPGATTSSGTARPSSRRRSSR